MAAAGSRWCATQTTSSSCAARQRKRSRPWRSCSAGPRRRSDAASREDASRGHADPAALTFRLSLRAGHRWPRKKSLRNSRTRCGRRRDARNGQSLEVIIENVNRTLRGWFGYFKHSPARLRPLDRGSAAPAQYPAAGAGRRGRGHGPDHQRWPNATLPSRAVFPYAAQRCSVSPSEVTLNWRAGCGKSACPVRREGETNSIASPYPYPQCTADQSVRQRQKSAVSEQIRDSSPDIWHQCPIGVLHPMPL